MPVHLVCSVLLDPEWRQLSLNLLETSGQQLHVHAQSHCRLPLRLRRALSHPSSCVRCSQCVSRTACRLCLSLRGIDGHR